jgi:hypothetical protein
LPFLKDIDTSEKLSYIDPPFSINLIEGLEGPEMARGYWHFKVVLFLASTFKQRDT